MRRIILRKYLLTGGFAAALLLGACSGEESGDSESTEEEATEEITDEETTEETTEDAEASADEEEIEQAKAEGADEATEDVEDVDTEVTETEESSNVETLKEAMPGETIQLENVNMTVNQAQVNRLTADENLAMLLDGVEAGDEVDNFVVEYTIENTTEEPRTFFIDQAEIVTSTGQQVMPELFLSDGITGDMQGAVSSTGTVPYLLEPGTGQDIEWVDIIVPNVSDESYMSLSEEQKYRIEFEQFSPADHWTFEWSAHIG